MKPLDQSAPGPAQIGNAVTGEASTAAMQQQRQLLLLLPLLAQLQVTCLRLVFYRFALAADIDACSSLAKISNT